MQEQQPSLLERLQGLSHSTKSRIVTVAVLISLLVLGGLWINDTKHNLSGIDNSTVLPDLGNVLGATNYIAVESYEEKGGKHYIYFKVQNNTPNILNFSKIENIKFEVGNQTLTPQSVTDRQQSSFVTKVLSNSTIYGMIIFEKFDGDSGELKFNEMFFENDPNNVFRESIEVDLSKLKPVEELRS
jgi:hypothetical protein